MTREQWALLVLQGKVAKTIDEAIDMALESIRNGRYPVYWLRGEIPMEYLEPGTQGWQKIKFDRE